MGDFTARRCIRRCVNWIDRWPAGPSGNTRSCEVICAGRPIGSRVSRDATRSCGRTGRWVSGGATWREPYELRGSSTVLREARGEIPRAYSPCGAGALSRQPSDGMGGIEIGGLARGGDQSGENACGETEGEGSETGLSGIHVPLLRRPERARVAVSQRESVGEGLEEGAEEAARHDRSSAMFPADSATDRAVEPAPERLEELLRLRLSHRGLRRDQLVRSRPSRAASETAQPAALPSAGRSQLLRADQALWPGPSLRTGDRATACASLRRQVFRRAGCREICSSGSTRGEWVGRKSRPLSYSTDLARNLKRLPMTENAIAKEIIDAAFRIHT